MKQRLAYLDNLKILLVVGVIAVHSAVTYGFDGTWYLESYDEMARGVVDALTVVIVIGWLFGLGLFFLIAGRLSGPSLDRKGPIAGAGHRESTGCARRCGPGSARGRTTGKRLSRCWMPERTSWWSCARAAQEGERCSDGPAHRGGLHGSRRADHSPDAPPRAGGRASARGRD
jgi:hypothetical protein